MENYTKSILLLLKRLFYVTITYSLLRILFLIFQWNAFHDLTLLNFIGGIRFDLSVIFYTNILVIIGHTIPGNFKYTVVYQKTFKWLFYASNILFLLTNFVDFIYYDFTGKRSTFGLITASGMQQEIGGLLPSFMKQFWHVFLIAFLFTYLFYKYIPKITFTVSTYHSKKHMFKQVAVFLIATASCLLIGRGGIQRKPLRRVDAIKYAVSKNTPIVLNTPFCILKTIGKKKELKPLKYFSEEKLNELYSPVKNFKDTIPFNKKNIVVIILESFGDENISYSSPKTGNTPFLDSLITKSLYFKNGFANGRVSVDAVPSVISGIPSILGTPYISSTYAFNKTNSFPEILKKEGYNTSFFHGAFNGSQNFDQYAKIAGYDNYYGKDEYPDKNPEHEDGKWGIFDEEFLSFFGKKLTSFQEPFFSSVFTISSHIPFTMPKKHIGKFDKGNTIFYETIGYTDYSLQKFFNYAKKQKWYNNTLFVITSDHCSAAEKGFFKSVIQEYSVPIIFFDPSNDKLKGESQKNIQQIDILPSVLDYLHYDKQIISYGYSYKKDDHLIINYINNTYHSVINDYYIIFDGEKIIELYNYKNDISLKNNLIKTEAIIIKELEQQLKAYLQSFNNNLINNSLTIN
ncbi:MAG: sulfatase-like hydrolase/transferase [Flavobacteriaceae bacterium]|nr:sulfatase-like hydrolase/transferase [Flavobacteriaceae bacterium]